MKSLFSAGGQYSTVHVYYFFPSLQTCKQGIIIPCNQKGNQRGCSVVKLGFELAALLQSPQVFLCSTPRWLEC